MPLSLLPVYDCIIKNIIKIPSTSSMKSSIVLCYKISINLLTYLLTVSSQNRSKNVKNAKRRAKNKTDLADPDGWAQAIDRPRPRSRRRCRGWAQAIDRPRPRSWRRWCRGWAQAIDRPRPRSRRRCRWGAVWWRDSGERQSAACCSWNRRHTRRFHRSDDIISAAASCMAKIGCFLIDFRFLKPWKFKSRTFIFLDLFCVNFPGQSFAIERGYCGPAFVCHKTAFFRNVWTDRTIFLYRRWRQIRPTLQCLSIHCDIVIFPKIRAFPEHGTFRQTLDLENFLRHRLSMT